MTAPTPALAHPEATAYDRGDPKRWDYDHPGPDPMLTEEAFYALYVGPRPTATATLAAPPATTTN